MADDLASLFKTGLVLECEDVPKKDKLKKLLVDVGGPDPLTIVTNAGNVGSRTVGMRVVVACVGAELRDGEKVKRAPVGGVTSCLLYTSPSPRDATLSRMPSSA